MRIRIAVAIDPEGSWNACGWGGPTGNPTDAEKMGIACDVLCDGERRYWVEVEIPDPEPANLPGTVTPAE